MFWSAAGVIAGALKRHVWIDRIAFKLFPNQYVILVGHGGVGKGTGINPAVGILREAGSANILSDNLTIQYVLEKLAKGFPSVSATPTGGLSLGIDASCFISAPELETFLTMSDAIPNLKELWECKDGPSDYGTKNRGAYKISKPCVTMVGGCTPSQIAMLFPTEVIGGGFTRRAVFVYESNWRTRIAFPQSKNGSFDKQREALVNDLRHISQLQGQFRFSKDAAALFGIYYHTIKIDEFADEATANFVTTKPMHVLKLAMCLNVAETDDLIITQAQIERAIFEIELCGKQLQKVFRAVGDSDLVNVTDKVLRYIEAHPAVTRQQVMGSLWRDVGSSSVLDVVIATLEAGGLVRTHSNHAGQSVFTATTKKGASQTP